MNQKKFMDDKEELVEHLAELGLKKKTARVLVFIGTNNDTTSREIEEKTGLRQPEVSIAVQDLKERIWIKTRYRNNKGKGRPVQLYSLKRQMSEVVEEIRREKEEMMRSLERKLDKVDSLVETIYL